MAEKNIYSLLQKIVLVLIVIFHDNCASVLRCITNNKSWNIKSGLCEWMNQKQMGTKKLY